MNLFPEFRFALVGLPSVGFASAAERSAIPNFNGFYPIGSFPTVSTSPPDDS